jgi:hypothetical protein
MNGRALRILLAALLVLGFSVLASGSASAASFSVQNASSSTINASTLNYPVNITITNSDTVNITQVNLTLNGFTFIRANSTDATNATFSNSSIIYLGWVNTTANGFIENGASKNFGFNVNTSSTPGYYNITVTATDTAGAQVSNNITYTLVLHNITFANSTAKTGSTATNNNVSYVINITNSGGPASQTYSLSVVNCNNVSQSGSSFGILNVSSVTLNSGESTIVQLNVSNGTAGTYSSCINASLSADGGIWSFTSSKDGVVLNSTFYFLDLNATALSFSNSSGGQNFFIGSNVTVNATLLNTGTQNFTGSMIVSFFWDGSFVGNQTVSSANLQNGTVNYSIFNITGGNVTTNGLHNITVQVDSLGNVAESNETNNNYTNSTIFVGYNVTIQNVTGYNITGLYNATPFNNVTLGISVKYPDGTLVSGLALANLSATDYYYGSVNTAPSISGLTGAGFYTLNLTTFFTENALATQPGIHNITFSVSGGSNNYTGSSGGNDYYYLITPKLTMNVTPESLEKNEEVSQSIYVYLTNTGNDTLYNVSITDNTSSGVLGFYGARSCNANISASTTTVCTIANVRSGDISGDQTDSVTVTIMGYYPFGNSTHTYSAIATSAIITINDLDTSTTTTTTTTGGGGSRKCTSDASCTLNETCSSAKTCVAISCPGGQIVNHACIAAADKINITDYGTSLSAISGGTNSTKVTIKNTGGTTFSAKLEITINNVTATVSPASYSLGAGESYQFTVNFTVPNSTAVGNFAGKYKAYVSTSTATYDMKSFSFIVLPKEETKAQINVSYQNLSAAFSLLISELNNMKASGRYNQSVLSSVEALVNAANSTLLQMKDAIDSDDYVSAQSLISQVNTSLNGAKAGMDNALVGSHVLGFDQGMWFWIAIVVIIVFVLGFFVYMFYPSGGPRHQGYHPEKGFVHPEAPRKEGVGARIKKKFKRKKKIPQTTTTDFARSMTAVSDTGHYETFHYSEGYKKEKSYGYEYQNGGVRGLFQRLRRRKSKKGPQMHIDQFASPPVAQES